MLNPYHDNSVAENWGASEGYATLSAVNSVYTLLKNNIRHTPDTYNPDQNYPNPFNPKTVIGWQLAANGNVDLSIYNILGQKVTTLISKKPQAGYYKVEWNTSGISSGVYFYRLIIEIENEQMIKTKNDASMIDH